MSDDKGKNDEDFGALTGDDDEGGFGNLPPLSDFDSADGESDGGLPPLDSDPGEDDVAEGGLPPIVDIRVDTPAVRPSDLDTPERGSAKIDTPGGGFDTPTNELDTPDPSTGLGFQDFAADSDFSPETPEIGPGPDSDIETPMFDSAFGGAGDDFSSGGAGTPAPTRAMETPMFDTGDSGLGFDNDAFSAPTVINVGMSGATPIPDFSPDTGMPQEMGRVAKKGGGGGGGGGSVGKGKVALAATVALVAGAAIGMFAGPMADLGFVPNKYRDQVQSLEGDVASKNARIKKLEDELTGGTVLTQAQIDEMQAQYTQLTENISQSTTQLTSVQDTLNGEENRLRDIENDIEIKNDEFITAAELFEDLTNEMTITRSRHEGLKSENDRLTDRVGELEVANERSQATLDTLLHNVELLTVQIQGGSPLAPQRFDHNARLAKVTDLFDKVSRAKWVTPQLLNEYTDLYVAELGIASSREYFFAKIPVHDSLGTSTLQWAECLMNGNWSVYFRTIDGLHVGSYENANASGAADYRFREDLPANIQADIASQIDASRVEGFEEKIAVLQGKTAIHENQTPIQKKFSSLLN